MATEKVLNQDRVRELWAAIKVQLAEKVNTSTLTSSYPTNEAMALAISTALTDYAKSAEVAQKIAAALSEYATEEEMNEAIQQEIGKITTFSVSVLDQLPQTGQDKVIYMVPAANSVDKNAKDEYLWVNGEFELIGSTYVDMTQYWSKEELQVMTSGELSEILV